MSTDTLEPDTLETADRQMDTEVSPATNDLTIQSETGWTASKVFDAAMAEARASDVTNPRYGDGTFPYSD